VPAVPTTATGWLTVAEATLGIEQGVHLHGEARERTQPQEEDGVAATSK
jgi:hypothetical protein